MMMRLSTILTTISFVLPCVASTEIYIVSDGGSCDGKLSLNSWDLSCGGDQYCAPGDGIEVALNAQLTEDLESDELCAKFDASVTLMTLDVYTKNVANDHAISICDYTEDGGCPAGGTYDFSVGGLKVPNFNPSQWMKFVGGRGSVTLYDSTCTTVVSSCTFDVATRGSNGSTTSMIIGTSFAVASLVGVLFFARRRTVRTESDDNGHGFELMSERSQQKGEAPV